MSLIVLASDKGSPGVTTTAVALAGVWPRRAILAECDPSGGDLVYRAPAESGAPLNPNIGMLSLATTARHGLSAHQLEQHIQRMHGGLELVVGLATGDQSAGLTGLWPALGRAFDSLPDTDVIADCGRVDATGPALELMAAASLVVLIARTSAEQIAHVRDRALSLLQRVGGGTAAAGGGLGVPIGVVLIVDPKQRTRVTAQVDELLRNSGLPVKVIGTIADDPDGADLINGRGRGRLDRTLLIRSTREVALDLSRDYGTPSQGPAMGDGRPMPQQPAAGRGPMPQQQYAAPPMQQPGTPPRPQQPMTGAGPMPQQQYAAPPMQQPTAPPRPPQAAPPMQQQSAPGMADPIANPQPQPQPQQPAPPTMADPLAQQPAPPPMTDPLPQHHIPASPAAPANGYPPPAQDLGTPQDPGTAKQPMFRRTAQPQPTVWPGEQPPAPAPSAHEGFTSVTLGGGPDPRGALPYRDGELDRLPPRDEIAPGRGGHRAGPPQGDE
ncbi:hypothetical protein ABH926_000637 [Catenulispora sp. GP43]|uniref:hypothetical protein n=1 Tax=Catenulispora sp. GP43 TaxID=3156263 RepID=UPI003516B81A